MSELEIKKPVFVDDIYALNPKTLYSLHLSTLAGILTDGEKVVFVKQSVTCMYSIAGRLGYVSVGKAEKDGVMKVTILHELKLGRWIFSTKVWGQERLLKADRFVAKLGLKWCGPTAVTSYDLRGEFVR